MSLFDRLVDQALTQNNDLSALRVVVEKELLHHDIMRVLSDCGMLEKLCFIGGTCLRACYGSNRLSEDLDFTAGFDFKRADLAALKPVLTERLITKYGLNVSVSEPVKDIGNVDTWKLKVETRPGARDMPTQRINIDICALPSHMSQPRLLLNPYGADMGTQGLIVNAEALEEIYIDKLLAFGLRRGRIKNRDLWDLLWLEQQRVKPAFELLAVKLEDHKADVDAFLQTAQQRADSLTNDPVVVRDFRNEMRRFLPVNVVVATVDDDRFWQYLSAQIPALIRQAEEHLQPSVGGDNFIM